MIEVARHLAVSLRKSQLMNHCMKESKRTRTGHVADRYLMVKLRYRRQRWTRSIVVLVLG